MELDNIARLKLLLSVEGIGPHKVLNLISKFSSIESIWHCTYNQLVSVDGIYKALADKIIAALKNLESFKEQTKRELDKLFKIKGSILTYWDEDYPAFLRKIYFPPVILYMLGKFDKADIDSLAIVGTRQPTPYGKKIAETLTADLVNNGLTIISGLARGIDSIAHSTALKNNGRTIAVIGSGLDVIYPPENKNLFWKIVENGAVISEYALGTKPDAQNFPRRNRIISGLSLGTLIIETKLNGGAMQTAEYALDQNREVFAVPGNLDNIKSEGPNTLIKKGEAKLVQCAEDILIELPVKVKRLDKKQELKKNIDLTLFEEKILRVLNSTPKYIDNIATECSMSTSDCLVNLLSLEFKGLVQQLPGKMFISV
ncbi:DNA-processing protein DprA [Melioribacteraceae bacterium 4301-Me]|uniref:DNA-processing protein DprA n=1 Tax=Pyranulibacter aquaticus TaxID=3163344 RepID=UPI003594CD4C